VGQPAAIRSHRLRISIIAAWICALTACRLDMAFSTSGRSAACIQSTRGAPPSSIALPRGPKGSVEENKPLFVVAEAQVGELFARGSTPRPETANNVKGLGNKWMDQFPALLCRHFNNSSRSLHKIKLV